MPLPYNREHKERSRELRKQLTPAEAAFWGEVRKKQLGVHFYRQKPLDQYVVDFYCPAAQLVVEIDGEHHRDEDHAEADVLRDQVLEQLGLRVLRFSNEEVLGRLEEVVARVGEVVRGRVGGSE